MQELFEKLLKGEMPNVIDVMIALSELSTYWPSDDGSIEIPPCESGCRCQLCDQHRKVEFMVNPTVKQVLKRVNREVGFPLSQRKIKKAGYDPSTYLALLAAELLTCIDIDNYREKLESLLKLAGS